MQSSQHSQLEHSLACGKPPRFQLNEWVKARVHHCLLYYCRFLETIEYFYSPCFPGSLKTTVYRIIDVSEILSDPLLPLWFLLDHCTSGAVISNSNAVSYLKS